jgi:hypothetical protein
VVVEVVVAGFEAVDSEAVDSEAVPRVSEWVDLGQVGRHLDELGLDE